VKRRAVTALGAALVALVARGDGARAQVPPPSAATAHVTSAALQLAALDRRIADLDTDDAADKRELDGLGAKIAAAHARVLSRGRALYRLTRAGMLPVGGGFDALVEHAMKVERMHHAVAADLASEKALREHAAELSQTLERIARDRVALGAQRQAVDVERAAHDDESRRQEAFDRAFATSTGASDYVAVYGGGASEDPGAPVGFSSSRGRLLFPVAGRAEARAARREGTDGPGLEIRAPAGSPVRSVFAGRIAFADRYGPYGRIVIVDHGEHYYTVSGNLGAIDVKVGQDIAAGERLGSVGDDGQGAMLYFEVRKGTETIAPAPWLGLP
jgi:murein DD-endopeptidase MepM/ murein hydrolase activator NlpD